MNLVRGDLWQEVGRARLILFAANSWLDSRGRLIMGKGSALEAKVRYPHLPAQIGEWLVEEGVDGRDFWLWVPVETPPDVTLIGALQTKRHWRDPADLALIEMSLVCLTRFLWDHSGWRVAMPFPGIGAGGLRREDVLPLLEELPDCVWVYER